MDKDKEILDGVHEEQKAEDEPNKEVSDEEIIEKIAEDLGLDPDDESDLLTKLLEREKAHREKLSSAIKQKISWREKARKLPEDQNSKNSTGKEPTTINVDELVDKKLSAYFQQRELEALNLDESLKEEVAKLAKLNNTSIREAAQSPYIQYRKSELEREERIKNATPKRKTSNGSYSVKIDPSKELDPSDFNFNTEEGIKAWDEAKELRRRHLNSQ